MDFQKERRYFIHINITIAQNKEGTYSTSSDTECDPIDNSETEVYIDVYKADDNFATSGATLLSDLDLQETYRATGSVATGRIPSLICDYRLSH